MIPGLSFKDVDNPLDRWRTGFGPRTKRPPAEMRAPAAQGSCGAMMRLAFLLPLVFLIPVEALHSASSSANYSIPNHSFGGGGGSAQSSHYTVQAITAGVGDSSSHAVSGLSNFAGFPGQLGGEPAALNAGYQVALNGAVAITLAGTDPEDDPLTFQVLSNPAHGTLTGTAPDLTYQAGASFLTVDQFTFVVSDGTFQSEPATITLIAPGANAPPSITPIPNQLVAEGQLLSVQVSASDPNQPAQSLAFSLSSDRPAGSTIDPNTGRITWTPTESQGPGVYQLIVIVTDNASTPLQATLPFTVTVAESNQSPSLATINDLSVTVGNQATLTAVAFDPDLPAQQLQFSLDPGAPAGAQIHSTTGAFTWTPGTADSGHQFPVTVRVTDNGTPALSGTQTFNIRVTGEPPPPSNTAPSLAFISDRVVGANTLLTFAAFASDADQPPQQLLFSLGPNSPGGAQIDPATGVFTWTPGLAAVGNQVSIVVIVRDNGSPALSALQSFNVTVTDPFVPPANSPPSLAPIGSRLVVAGTTLSFTVSAADADRPSQQLAFSLDPGAPPDASIASATGVFTWTVPSSQPPGEIRIAITVTDNGSPRLSATQIVNVAIVAPNTPPLLPVLPNQAINEGTLLAFPVAAADRDIPAQNLSYALEPGAPAGTQFDPATLMFSWTPTEAQGPGVYPITLRVTDNGDPPLSATTSFSVSVLEVNSPPMLASIPEQHVRAGQTLEFTALATDTDLPAQSLTYSLAEAPNGATIDARTGRFNWTPPAVHPGGNVTFTVTARDDALIAGSASQVVRINVTPNPPATAPSLLLTQSSRTEIQLTLIGPPGTCFRLETTTNLRNWDLLSLVTVDANGRFTFSDGIAAGLTGKWYRAVVVPCDAPGPPQWSGAIEISGGQARFSFRGTPNGCYLIESTSDFREWTPVINHQADATGDFLFITPIAAPRAQIFRAREIACP